MEVETYLKIISKVSNTCYDKMWTIIFKYIPYYVY